MDGAKGCVRVSVLGGVRVSVLGGRLLLAGQVHVGARGVVASGTGAYVCAGDGVCCVARCVPVVLISVMMHLLWETSFISQE